MRLLLLTNYGLGAYRFHMELIEEILSEGIEVFISFPEDEYKQKFEKLGCRYIDVKLDRRGTNPMNDLRLLFAYYRMIRRIKPDLVLTFTVKPNIYGGIVCRAAKLPYIANITGLGSSLVKQDLLQRMVLRLYKIGLKGAACVFYQNQENCRFFREKRVYRGREEVLPGAGINLEQFLPVAYPEEREELNLLYIGRIMKEKGMEELFQVIRRVKVRYPKVQFHIVGILEENYGTRLSWYEEEGFLKFHGSTEDVRPYLAKTHVLILPSYHEGLANVLLEAAATGRPVLTSDIAGCRETLEDGVSGYVFVSRDTDSLEEAICRFIQLPYSKKKQMGLAGRRKMELEFDRKIVIDAYWKVIRSFCSPVQPSAGGNDSQCQLQPTYGEDASEGSVTLPCEEIGHEDPIRILQIFATLDRGGAETEMMNLYRHMDRTKVQFDFVVNQSSREYAYEAEVKGLGGRVFYLPRYRGFNHFRFRRAWTELLKEHPEWSILHGHHTSCALIYLKVARRLHRTTIVHSHSTAENRSLSGIIKYLMRLSLRFRADYLFACSGEAADWMFGRRDRPVRILKNAIEVKRYSYSDELREQKRRELGLETSLVVGHIGNFTKPKNYPFLLKVFKIVKQRHPASILLLIGKYDNDPGMKDRINSLGLTDSVILTGVREDIPELLQAMDVFLFPSLYEGIPVSLIEAQASGIRCIVSDAISREAKVTELLEYVSLKEPPEYWADRVLYRTQGNMRSNPTEDLCHRGYDVISNAKWLEEFYRNLVDS